MPDAEIEALGKVVDALGPLEEEEQGRIIRWAAERYGVALVNGRAPLEAEDATRASRRDMDNDTEAEDARDDGDGSGPKTFEDFADLYDATSPTTDVEKVLVAGYWTQVVMGKPTFGSRELNKELKDLGHAVGAINKAMTSNMNKKPALIIQVSRGGSSPQAQKKYKVSEAGKKWVQERLG